MNTLKAVIWDLDGTLLDSAPDLADAVNALLAEYDLDALPESHVRAMIGNGVGKLIERGFRAAGRPQSTAQLEQLIPRFLQIYTANATQRSQLYPNALTVLQSVADSGLRQGICTNKPEAISRKILADMAIDHYFDVVVGGDSTANRKPDPMPMLLCLDCLRVTSQQALFIGDSKVDVDTARALSMPIGLVTFGYARQQVSSLNADFLIPDYAMLPGLISEMRKTS